MSEPLKPCPFCGGGHIEIVNQGSMPDDPHVVQCDDCDASASGMSMGEAIAAWNRRAERTCCVVRDGGPSATGIPRELRCSECGGRLSRFGSYCPHCGARVVGAFAPLPGETDAELPSDCDLHGVRGAA